MTQTQFVKSGGTNVVLDEEVVQQLAERLPGRLIGAADPRYDNARAVWNGMIERRPALIAACTCTEDVVACVDFARAHGLLLSVRGGGHNMAGSAICNDGLVIDLSPMKKICVDPVARTARAEGGVTWAELDGATQEHGLATAGGLVSETGIAGLTLGGGAGWLRNKHGLSCDNLIGATLVTADGQVRAVNEHEHADLLWALRGGGGNFGVVTEFEYRLHAVGPEVALCFVLYPIAQAWEALRFFDRYAAVAPDEVSTIAVIGTVPHADTFPTTIQGERFVLFGGCYIGAVDEGLRIMQPLRQWRMPLIDFSDVMPYVDVQKLWDADYPAGRRRYYWKSIYVDSLRDEVIDCVLSAAAARPSHYSNIDIWHIGGAVSRVAAGATAFGRRDLPYMIGIEANWEEAAGDETNISWARSLWADLQRFSSGAVYLNFPGLGEEGEALVRASYGENYARLAVLKRTYDPANLFRMNQNIRPAEG